MSTPSAPHYDSRGAERSLLRWTAVIYGLHAFSIASGILGTATVIGAFLTGWPSIVAVIPSIM